MGTQLTFTNYSQTLTGPLNLSLMPNSHKILSSLTTTIWAINTNTKFLTQTYPLCAPYEDLIKMTHASTSYHVALTYTLTPYIQIVHTLSATLLCQPTI